MLVHVGGMLTNVYHWIFGGGEVRKCDGRGKLQCAAFAHLHSVNTLPCQFQVTSLMHLHAHLERNVYNCLL